MSTTAVPKHVLTADPSEQEEIVELREQLARMAARRRRPVAKLVSPDGIEVEVGSAFAALEAVVLEMAQRLTITLIHWIPAARSSRLGAASAALSAAANAPGLEPMLSLPLRLMRMSESA